MQRCVLGLFLCGLVTMACANAPTDGSDEAASGAPDNEVGPSGQGNEVGLGGQSGDPGNGSSQGGQSGDPGDGMPTLVPLDECQLSTWHPDDPEPTLHRCELQDRAAPRPHGDAGQPLPTLWECECGGELKTTRSSTCHDALVSACEADALAPQYCTQPAFGTCFPEQAEPSSWLCRCDDTAPNPGVEAAGVAIDDCREAVMQTCGQQCEDEVGRCETNADDPDTFICRCEAAADAEHFGNSEASPVGAGGALSAADLSCEEALAETCGTSCISEAGSCTLNDDRYTCTCPDGTHSEVALDSLEEGVGAAACRDALGSSCGRLSPAPGGECNSTHEGATGHCRGVPYVANPAMPQEVYDYDCTCLDPEGSEPERAALVQATTCSEAVALHCPSALRPTPSTDGPLGDYGALCENDAECSGGACYIPGTQDSPICSKACDSDADCPELTRCAQVDGSYCFVECSTDEECVGLNASVSNPLYCFELPSDSSSAGICIQRSEP